MPGSKREKLKKSQNSRKENSKTQTEPDKERSSKKIKTKSELSVRPEEWSSLAQKFVTDVLNDESVKEDAKLIEDIGDWLSMAQSLAYEVTA